MTKEEYFGEWLKVIPQKEFDSIISKLKVLYKQSQCTPDYKNIFKVFNVTPYDKLKVVIIGQDPYPQKGIATGIAFGNNDSVNLSPSLEVIKEAVINYELPFNMLTFDSSLHTWSVQGVLLFNSALTVEIGKPQSHAILWHDFVSKFLIRLSNYNPGLIYVLLGSNAKLLKRYISSNNHIIEDNHPSYYVRTHTKMSPELFRNINKLTKYYYDEEISWCKKE